MTNDICPCGITKASCEYHSAPAVIRSETHNVSAPVESAKKAIQRLCATGRLIGIYVRDVQVAASVFDELTRDLGLPALLAPDGEQLHAVNTANGYCVVKKDKP